MLAPHDWHTTPHDAADTRHDLGIRRACGLAVDKYQPRAHVARAVAARAFTRRRKIFVKPHTVPPKDRHIVSIITATQPKSKSPSPSPMRKSRIPVLIKNLRAFLLVCADISFATIKLYHITRFFSSGKPRDDCNEPRAVLSIVIF